MNPPGGVTHHFADLRPRRGVVALGRVLGTGRPYRILRTDHGLNAGDVLLLHVPDQVRELPRTVPALRACHTFPSQDP